MYVYVFTNVLYHYFLLDFYNCLMKNLSKYESDPDLNNFKNKSLKCLFFDL